MNSTKRWLAFLLAFGMILAACGGTTSETTVIEEETTETTEAEAAEETETTEPAEEPSGDATEIRWFVGLGTGSNVDQIEAQEDLVAAYNASQDDIELVIEFVDNEQAYGVLNTQIAAGDAPDIVGPVGIRGRDGFPGAWLDIQPLVDASGYDLSDFDADLVKFYEDAEEGLLGLPFAVFPQFMYYNQDLFDEAGLAYPPTEFGAPYVWADGTEADWDIDTMRELALLLTVDANGADASSADFDRDNVVQFGFGNQWTDMRGLATVFGPGNLVDADNNAVIPDSYREAMEWYQALAWEDGSYPFGEYGGADFLGAGNWFNSGNMGMAAVHMWYATCCVGDIQAAWNVAVMPSANGQTTAKLHADTFAITKGSDNPDAAFEVLQFLIGEAAPELLQIYGGMPARTSLQDSFFDELDAGQFAGMGIEWDVVSASLAYNDNPNHEAGLPNSQEAQDCYNRVTNKLFVDPDFDVNAALDQLEGDLQAIYDGTGGCTLEQ